ncbi:MAG: D-alanyl-D-alanine carboxypeptidase family protein [Ruminococcaceae bacterium]|nr:D-alanyl-D-alanine carboxypeptidase family protein [Oscillospiraceae bacterium]
MARKSKGIALLLLVVLLLVLISSRTSPRQALRPKTPVETDDPLPSVTDVPVVTAPPEATPTPPPQIQELLPGLSRNDWNLRLVNNTYILPNTFAPDVTAVRDDQYFDSRAADALEEMLKGAEAEGYSVCIRTGYRPFSTQAYLFNGRASQIQWGTTMTLLEAEQEARKVVAYPGTSEHQLGLAADIMDSKDSSMKAESAEGLPLLKWLREHCAEYGFILRYPKDKQDITGWYEPWHFRYVGKDAARYIMDRGICLEEFIALF